MKPLLFLFFFILNSLSGCSDHFHQGTEVTGTLIGYVYHPSNNWQANVPLYLEISRNGKTVYKDIPGIGEFRLDNLVEGDYLVRYYNEAGKLGTNTQEIVKVQEGKASFVTVNAFCSAQITIYSFPELMVPIQELSEFGEATGSIDFKSIMNSPRYAQSFGNETPTAKVVFYKIDTSPQDKNAIWEPLYSTKTDSLQTYSLDSLPAGFYQAQALLDPFSSEEAFEVLILPNKKALINFSRFGNRESMPPFDECQNVSYQRWTPSFQ